MEILRAEERIARWEVSPRFVPTPTPEENHSSADLHIDRDHQQRRLSRDCSESGAASSFSSSTDGDSRQVQNSKALNIDN